MTTVRELTAKLAFQVDTTGATRFDAALNRSRKNLDGLNTVSLAGLVKTATKAFAIVATVATAGSLAAAKKFADIQTSWDALEFSTKEGFAPLKKEIDSILQDKTFKNLVDEIDLVNAALAQAQEKGVSGDDLTKFLRLAVTLSIPAKKSVAEVLDMITGFVGPEADLGILKLIGKLPQEFQELLKFLPGPGKAGLIARRETIFQDLLTISPQLEKLIAKQREEGLLTFRELSGAFEKLTIEIGENTLPVFKNLNDVLIPFVERLTKLLKGEIKPKEFIEEIVEETRVEPKIASKLLLEWPKLFKGLFDFSRFLTPNVERANKAIQDINKQQRQQDIPSTDRITPFASQITNNRGGNQTTTNRGGDITITVPITVQSGATADPTAIKQAVNQAIRESMGGVLEESRAGTLRRGGD